jgi:hypothetical protein
MLSKKYEISIIQVITNKNGKVSKIYNTFVTNVKTREKFKDSFTNKKSLVSWLLCLK